MDHLRSTLQSIREMELPDNVFVFPLLINDGSTDQTKEMLTINFREVCVIEGDGNWWWTKCMNEGFKRAMELDSDFVLVLNDDSIVKSDFIKLLLRDYESLNEECILGSASVSLSNPTLIESSGSYSFNRLRCRFNMYHKANTKLDSVDFYGIHPTFNLSGRGSLIPVSVLKSIGLFDEKLIQYGSDDEFALRARKNKIPVYISWNARVYNKTHLTSKGSAFLKGSLSVFAMSFFDRYSVNSIKKASYIYCKYGYKFLTPIYVVYFILGTCYARFIKYR